MLMIIVYLNSAAIFYEKGGHWMPSIDIRGREFCRIVYAAIQFTFISL